MKTNRTMFSIQSRLVRLAFLVALAAGLGGAEVRVAAGDDDCVRSAPSTGSGYRGCRPDVGRGFGLIIDSIRMTHPCWKGCDQAQYKRHPGLSKRALGTALDAEAGACFKRCQTSFDAQHQRNIPSDPRSYGGWR
jgi:hypothetical protein